MLGYVVLVVGGTNRTTAMENIMDTSVLIVVVTHALAWATAFVMRRQRALGSGRGGVEVAAMWWLVVATVVAAVVPSIGVMSVASSWYVSLSTAADVGLATMLALSDYVVVHTIAKSSTKKATTP